MADLRALTAETVIINLNAYDERDLARHLKAIAEAFENYRPAQDALIREFPCFAEKRVANIEYLNKVADKLEEHHRNCNIAKVVGASGGVLGGIAGVAGAIFLTMATGSNAAPVIAAAAAIGVAAGGITASLGGATAFGTYLTSRVIEKGKEQNVKALLEEDKAYIKKICPCIQRVAKLEEAVEGIMSFSVFQGLMFAFNKDPGAADAIRVEAPIGELPQRVKNFMDDLSIAEDQKRRLKELMLAIIRSVECCRLLRGIIIFSTKNAFYSMKTYRFIYAALNAFRFACAMFDTDDALTVVTKSAKPATQLSDIFGAQCAVSVAIDIWVLLSTSEDMAKDIKSDLTRRIRRCTHRMQIQLKALKQIYVACCINVMKTETTV